VPPKFNNTVELALNNSARSGVPVSRYAVYCFLMIAGFAADQITKYAIFGKYFDPDARVPAHKWLIENWLAIETTTNQGALFGMGQKQTFWFVLLSFIAIAGIAYWLFVHRAAISWTITIALGMVTGGIFGNLYDRLGLWHGADIADRHSYAVRDWIHFRWPSAPSFLQSLFNPWPNFNIADSLLVCGAIALVVHAFFFAPPGSDQATPNAPASTPASPSTKQ
jgi:signal peptidase II